MSHRGSWHSSPPLISPPLLIILLPIITLTLLFLTVPPLLSAASNILRPASVKTSWDSLNILLVVCAILFGVFARRNDDEPSLNNQSSNDVVPDNQNDIIRRVTVSSGESGYESRQWFGFSSEESNKVFDETPKRWKSPVTGINRLRRTSSSYPDLRQLETGDDRYKFRFFDDFEIEKQFRSPARATFPAVNNRKRWPEERSQQQEEEQVHVKEIPVDTFEVRPSSPPVRSPSTPPPPPPPPPPPLVSSRRHPRHRRVESRSEITELDDREFTRIQSQPLDPPTVSPPRTSVKTRSEQKNGKSERRKSNVKREIAMVWASVLSNQRKRKKKVQRSKNDHNHNHHYDNVDEFTNNTAAPPMTPPPPPPPPPPPSVFQSIFRKGLGKSKKIHSMSVPLPPPLPSRRSTKPKNQVPLPPQFPPPTPPRRGNRGKPPLPNKSSNLINETLNTGNQSPLIPVPPPLPPFKMPAMKFVVRGDFVKIRSNQSSRSTSPEREHIDVEVLESETTTITNTGDESETVFCPSPDVNVKAATFIARLRGEWRLQKLNSIKEKGNGSLPLTRD